MPTPRQAADMAGGQAVLLMSQACESALAVSSTAVGSRPSAVVVVLLVDGRGVR